MTVFIEMPPSSSHSAHEHIPVLLLEQRAGEMLFGKVEGT